MALPLPPAGHGRRPTCTHMMMRRLYGDNTCGVCGKVPPMRWLYVCHQDTELRRVNQAAWSSESTSIIQNGADYFQAMAALARRLNMSEGVVRGIQAGHYTFDQVDILIAQKEHVDATIRRQLRPHGRTTAPTLGDVLQSHEPNAPPSSTPLTPSTPPGLGSTSTIDSILNLPIGCGFRVCHTCRPQFADRATTSLGSALRGEIPPITQSELKYLRVLDARVLKTIGLRECASFAGGDNTTGRDGSSDWSDPDGSEHDSSSYDTDTALSHDGSLDNQSRSFTSLSTPVRGGDCHASDAYDTPGRSTASSMSLPTPSTPARASLPKLHDCTSNITKSHITSHARSISNEIVVHGGVALTEEAVRNGAPDILTP